MRFEEAGGCKSQYSRIMTKRSLVYLKKIQGTGQWWWGGGSFAPNEPPLDPPLGAFIIYLEGGYDDFEGGGGALFLPYMI